MKSLVEILKEEYQNYCQDKNIDWLQSVEFAEMRKKRGAECHFVALKNDENIEVAGLIIGEIIPLLIGFEKPKSAKTKLLIFSKSFNEFGIPKIIFNIEKSKKIETKSGEVIIKNNISAAIFW